MQIGSYKLCVSIFTNNYVNILGYKNVHFFKQKLI